MLPDWYCKICLMQLNLKPLRKFKTSTCLHWKASHVLSWNHNNAVSESAWACKWLNVHVSRRLPCANYGFFKQPQANLYCTSYCCFTTARFHLNWSLLVSGHNFGLGMSFGSHKLIDIAHHSMTDNIFASIEDSLSVVSGPRLLTSVATSSWPRGDEAKIGSQMGRGQDPLKTHRFGYLLYQFNNCQY